MEQITSILAPLLSAIAIALVGYVLGRRKQASEAALNEIQATEKAIAIWRQLAQDFQKEILELKDVVDELKQENARFKHEINSLKKAKQ